MRRGLTLGGAIALGGCFTDPVIEGSDGGAGATGGDDDSGVVESATDGGSDDGPDPGTTSGGDASTGSGEARWAFRRQIKLALNPAEDGLRDVPVLIELDDEHVDYAAMQADGADLRFVDADDEQLSHEIESWDSDGRSVVWLRIPKLEATAAYWMIWGNPDAEDGQDVAGVWSGDYAAVWHVTGSGAGGLEDSSGNGNASEGLGAGVLGDGRFGAGLVAASSTLHVPSSPALQIPGSVTLEGWVKPEAYGDASDTILVAKNNNYRFEINDVGDVPEFRIYWNDIATPVSLEGGAQIPTGAWVHLAAVWSNADDQMLIYIDGVQVYDRSNVNGGAGLDVNDDPVELCNQFSGDMDEVRISRAARPAPWLAVQYRAAIGTLIMFGAVEQL